MQYPLQQYYQDMDALLCVLAQSQYDIFFPILDTNF